jgi:hypothetical protein
MAYLLSESMPTEVKLDLELRLIGVLLIVLLVILLIVIMNHKRRLREKFGMWPGGSASRAPADPGPDPWSESARRLRADPDDPSSPTAEPDDPDER